MEIIKNKRGQLGLDTVRTVLVFLLLLGVIAIAVIIAVVVLSASNVVPETVNNGGTIENISINLTNAGRVPAGVTLGNTVTYENIVMRGNHSVISPAGAGAGGDNNDSIEITSGNYTTNATGGILNSGSPWQNHSVDVSLGWDYTTDSAAIGVRGNVSAATVDFFENIPTVFVILGAVVIILAVTLILFAVNRFTGGAGVRTEL